MMHETFKSVDRCGPDLFLALVVCAFCVVFHPAPAHAGLTVTPEVLETESCHPTYYETLKSRAWMEGQRRTMQAQNYIFKPDSVLDYSCFGILNNIAAEETEQIFSQAHAGHCYPESLDCALDILVISALGSYMDGQYNHTMLGGRSTLERPEYDPESTEMCTMMRDVWQLAKCTNFMLEPAQDGFLSFTEYVSTDPRLFPEPCEVDNAALWEEQIENAFTPPDADAWRVPMIEGVGQVGRQEERYTLPGNVAPGCGPFIRTGIIIQDDASILYRIGRIDGVCANPACSPNENGQCVVVN